MKHLKKFESTMVDDIFIDSEPIEHDKQHRTTDDAYCGYEVALKGFSYNNVKVEQAKGDVAGDDFKGFSADLEIQLSNGLFIVYSHDASGAGRFICKTKNETPVFEEDFDLTEMEDAYAPVLINCIKKVLDFNF